ncbi:Cuticlin-1 [Aphelenchoides besseyi]|nr:Cuticlin-1 [Aphelenchoides besseyi]
MSRRRWSLISLVVLLIATAVNAGAYGEDETATHGGATGGSTGGSTGGGTEETSGSGSNGAANGQIPNQLVGEPSVSCGAESVSIDLQTTKSFSGRIFVKGYSQDANCMLNGSGGKVHGFSINFDQCGLRRTRELNGVGVSATVVISFHPIFITKADRAYKVNCFYMEARKTVNQNLEVSALTTKALTRQAEMPVCKFKVISLKCEINVEGRYEILDSPNGQPVRYAKIGDRVYHKWTCETEVTDVYCMRVHSCTVNDGSGGEAVYVLDENGCEIDRYVLQNLDYTGDLTAGQTSYVFKFADKPTLHFNCQIELSLKDRQAACTKTHPQCPSGHRGSGGYGEQQTTSNGADSYGGNTRSGTQTEVTPSHYGEIETAETPSAYDGASMEVNEGSSYRPGGSPPGVAPHHFTTQGYTPGTRAPSSHPAENDYKRIVKRDDSQKVADFDLPEQSLVVIEIDDDVNRSAAETAWLRKSSQRSSFAPNSSVCLSSAILAGLFGLCAVLCGVISVFLFAALRKHRTEFQKQLLKF